jgi:UDP-3-O-[3-hydroxymyristoyl] glucosamine N-acyltransferase
MKTAQQIADFVSGTLYGNGAEEINTIGSLEHAEIGALAYAETHYVNQVQESKASCVLVTSNEFPNQTVIVVDNPRLAFAKAAEWLCPQSWPAVGVHSTAIVENKAILEKNVSVGALAVIETGSRIGHSTIIFPGCYIGKDCRIGNNCIIYPHAVLYSGVEIGDYVTIHAGVVLGADGFGFVFDGTRHIKVPQIGHVKIGSEVEIGANSCVDRGALDETILNDGVKIDNLCQIAHNVKIDTHAIISSQTGIAGSSRVGKRATIGGQVGIGDYCQIDDQAMIGGQGGVVSRKRIPAGQIYWGTPARPLKDIKTKQAYLGRLPKMAEELKRLREEVEKLKIK